MTTKAPQKGSPHHFLAQLVGPWKGTSKLWLEPGKLADESALFGSVQLILEGRFALFLYQGSIDGEPQHGMYTFGYNTTTDHYEASWVDSFHNNSAIMFCSGVAIEKGFAVTGSYPDPAEGPDWAWRTEVVLEDADHLRITAYNITPKGKEYKATETLLTRGK